MTQSASFEIPIQIAHVVDADLLAPFKRFDAVVDIDQQPYAPQTSIHVELEQ
jgi:hypothetical protein